MREDRYVTRALQRKKKLQRHSSCEDKFLALQQSGEELKTSDRMPKLLWAGWPVVSCSVNCQSPLWMQPG
jgi:hypothetical protein